MAVRQSMLQQPAATIAAALRDGETDARSLLDDAAGRHEAFGERLNAYLTWTPDLARKAAEAADAAFAANYDLGPLQGLPVSIKDIYGVRGMPTYGGSGKPLPEAWTREGPVVASIKAGLAVITGKTHTVEFAAGGIGDNVHWGAPRNPWSRDEHRAPGGSSSGAGVSLWEGSALFAFGSDTIGSVRIPASMTGTVGLKITYGRWPEDGIVPLRRGLDTPGPLARTVADAAFVFAALDPAHRDEPLVLPARVAGAQIGDFRLGIADACFWDGCDRDVAACVRAAIGELERAGARIADAPSPEAAELLPFVMSGGFPNTDLLSLLENELAGRAGQIDPALAARIESARNDSVLDHLRRQRWLQQLRTRAIASFSGFDAVLSPTVPVTPPLIVDGAPVVDKGVSPIITARNTCAANFFAQCALSMPAGLDSRGLPAGLQIVAPGGQEEKLLAIAAAAERVLGTPLQRLGQPPLLD